MKFDMTLEDNFASFTDSDGLMIFIDSFDNKIFDVRIGTSTESEAVGSVEAMSDKELNERILALYKKYKGI